MSKNNGQSTIKEDLSSVKKSIWGEINSVSGAVLAVMVAIVVLAIAAFIYMNRVPPKKVVIKDDADIFTKEEIEELKDLAKDLKSDKDVNVVIATTRNNPKGLTDNDCKQYAAQIYKENCIHTSMQDNSGFCIFVDLTQDKPGMRFFWLYTYGTSYYSVNDESCQQLFGRYRKELSSEEYYTAISSILEDLSDYEFHSEGLALTYILSVVIPLILASLITLICTFRKSLDRAPGSAQYIVKTLTYVLETTDKHKKTTRRVYHNSSSGGGGGHGGGGGGGGHSGGGGGRF